MRIRVGVTFSAYRHSAGVNVVDRLGEQKKMHSCFLSNGYLEDSF